MYLSNKMSGICFVKAGNVYGRRGCGILSKRVCIVVPIYKKKPDNDARLCIDRIQSKLSCYDVYFMTYRGLGLDAYRRLWKQPAKFHIAYFPKRYFKNTFTYSRLLLKEGFYKAFSGYEYMLIVQTDALVLGDANDLESFMDKKYDYWGARWIEPVEICSFEIEKDRKKKLLKILPRSISQWLFKNPKYCDVGNGGFSLRHINKTIALLKEKKKYAHRWLDNEDKFFAYHGLDNHVKYRIAPASMVDKFSQESIIKESLDTKNPFGVHAWRRKGRFQVINYLKKQSVL